MLRPKCVLLHIYPKRHTACRRIEQEETLLLAAPYALLLPCGEPFLGYLKYNDQHSSLLIIGKAQGLRAKRHRLLQIL